MNTRCSNLVWIRPSQEMHGWKYLINIQSWSSGPLWVMAEPQSSEGRHKKLKIGFQLVALMNKVQYSLENFSRDIFLSNFKKIRSFWLNWKEKNNGFLASAWMVVYNLYVLLPSTHALFWWYCIRWFTLVVRFYFCSKTTRCNISYNCILDHQSNHRSDHLVLGNIRRRNWENSDFKKIAKEMRN